MKTYNKKSKRHCHQPYHSYSDTGLQQISSCNRYLESLYNHLDRTLFECEQPQLTSPVIMSHLPGSEA